MNGTFLSEITYEGDTPFLIVKTTVYKSEPLINGNVVQSYVQFQDPNILSAGYTDVICQLTHDTSVPESYFEGKVTCGELLLKEIRGPVDSVANQEQCATETGWEVEGDNIHEIVEIDGETRAICTSHRMFSGPQITQQLKIGKKLNYWSGFNIYRDD